MACTPFNYTNYSEGTAGCVSNRASCSTNNAITLSAGFGVTGNPITAADVNTLRAAIINEIAAWNAWNTSNGVGDFSVTDPGTISAGQVIDHSQINTLNNDLATITQYSATSTNGSGGGYTITNGSQIVNPGVSASTGGTVTAPNWSAILNSYNTLRQDCICNSDCHCNTVCACYGDCGCNYSDERLKENIEFIETKQGLNIYSWNYKWDKVTRHIGVMAQEILNTVYASAVIKDRQGYYMVDYSKLPI